MKEVKERKIIHIDMDAFYASVEQRDNPSLRGRPVAVGRAEERGVVAAASYQARRFGVKSAMPSVKAMKLCPELVFVPARMDVYRSVSASIHDIFHRYTDVVEPLALDEAFLDVTDNKKGMQYAMDIAAAIKSEIRAETGLVASAGVSYNKFLAKIASDYRKPDGLYVIHPSRAAEFISRLPIESFWGVGGATAERMRALGITDGASLRERTLSFLTARFGKKGRLYYDFAHGEDNRPVEPFRERKSVAREHTLERDVTALFPMTVELYNVVKGLMPRLEKAAFSGRTLTLKLKFDDFSVKTYSVTRRKVFSEFADILDTSKALLRQSGAVGRPVRLIGVSLSNSPIGCGGGTQLSMDDL